MGNTIFIKEDDLLSSSELVIEPLKKISNLISNSGTKKVILYGSRGAGKTITLRSYARDKVMSKNPAMFMRFDSCQLFGDKTSRRHCFDEQFIIHFYELVMAEKILCYIKQYYGRLYEDSFVGDMFKVDSTLSIMDNYIRNSFYSEIKLNEVAGQGDITSGVIKKFKKLTKSNTVSLIIDRFDWTDGHSQIAQKTLREYHGLFDKMIITTDDEDVCKNEELRSSIAQGGSSFIEVDYGKDLKTLKKIVELRINRFNTSKGEKEPFIPLQLEAEIYEELIKGADGNIDIILRAINSLNNIWQWEDIDFARFNAKQKAKSCIEEEIISSKELKKRSAPIKLYY